MFGRKRAPWRECSFQPVQKLPGVSPFPCGQASAGAFCGPGQASEGTCDCVSGSLTDVEREIPQRNSSLLQTLPHCTQFYVTSGRKCKPFIGGRAGGSLGPKCCYCHVRALSNTRFPSLSQCPGQCLSGSTPAMVSQWRSSPTPASSSSRRWLLSDGGFQLASCV